MLGTAWGLGSVIGPALCGAIADPIGQYNLNISSEFINMATKLLLPIDGNVV